MKIKVIIPAILFIVFLVFSIFVLLQEENQTPIAGTEESQAEPEENIGQAILFYGNGCPHCKIVEEYIEENNIQDKLSFVRKEVYYNKDNALDLEAKAKICGLPARSIGVPFFWDGEKCFIGDRNIIKFFQEKNSGQ